MCKSKLLLVLALGLAVSLTSLNGCGKKPVPPAPAPVVAKEEPKPAPAPAPAPVIPEPPKKVEEAPQPPSNLAFTTVYFDLDKSDIRADQTGTLNTDGNLLNQWKTITVRLEGNCDERGTVEYNLALGQRRADSVKSYLVNYGISDSRITTVSYGEERPVDPGHSESAWAKNRRVDFAITNR
ncbi:MAG: peptidoglycan-associated lipoprotein Pal [Candidatus Latescibacterota bacterium]